MANMNRVLAYLRDSVGPMQCGQPFRSPMSLQNELDALRAFKALLDAHLAKLLQNPLSLSEADSGAAGGGVTPRSQAALSEVHRRNRANAQTLLAGEARVLRHYISLATVSSAYAQGLLAQVPNHMAAREQRRRANGADGAQAADADLAVDEIDTRLGATAEGKRHHSQIAQYCKVRTYYCGTDYCYCYGYCYCYCYCYGYCNCNG